VLETTGRIIADWLTDNPHEPAPDLSPLLALLGAISDNQRQRGGDDAEQDG
jgi:hypothetical protein